MIKKQDIQKAMSIFKEWDNNQVWDSPTALFTNHTLKKSEDSLNTAKALFNIMQNDEVKKKVLPNIEYNTALWIINAAYYSMFFLGQVLLAKDSKKLPAGTKDTHKSILLAILYYFVIKGSGVEGKKTILWEDIKNSRMSNAFCIFEEAQEEAEELLQVRRVKEAINSLQLELDKRTELTYRSTKDAEISYACTSIERAEKFREIVMEYLTAKNQI